MNWPSTFNDITTGVSTGVLAIAAVLGLRAWQAQLAGTASHEVARSVLRSVLRTRDAIRRVRNPFLSAGEQSAAVESRGETLSPDGQEAELRRYELAYDARLRELQIELTELEANLIEAEVLWGALLGAKAREFRGLAIEVSVAVGQHLRARREPPRNESYTGYMKKIEMTLWEGGDGTSDPFADQLAQSISNLEALIRPKLAR